MRYDWVYLEDEAGAGVGVVSPEVAVLLLSEGVARGEIGPDRKIQIPSKKNAAPESVILKKFSGASADVEIEYLNSDNKVWLDRALIGTNKTLYPQGNASNKTFTSLNEWLVAVHALKEEGHKLTCFSAPKERVTLVLDRDTDMTYSLPFRHLYATEHGIQPPTVKAWGFENDPLEFLRQVRDHNLREFLITGTPDSTNEGVLDAQPDHELENLWKEDSEEILAAFNAHAASMKREPGYLKSR